MDYWIPDIETYNKLQHLKSFVDFVAGLPDTSNESKMASIEINRLIENINNPATYKSWNVCLDIYDRDLQYRNNKDAGIYWRSWSIYFEMDGLQIEAKSKHIDEPLGHYGSDFNYYAVLFFKKEIPCNRIYMTEDIQRFVEDALNYKIYVSEKLNDIEIEIEVS